MFFFRLTGLSKGLEAFHWLCRRQSRL